MQGGALISTERQAREAEEAIAVLDHALSSEESFRRIVEGLPNEVVEAIRRSLQIERRDQADLLSAYRRAKDGDFAQLRDRAGDDPGAFLIVARIIKGLSQKELARKLGLREQAIQRWETERYRSISLSNYQKVAQTLGVRWQLKMAPSSDPWPPFYDVKRDDVSKVLRHARDQGWLRDSDKSDENAVATLVRYIGDHVTRYGTPSLLRTGLNVKDLTQDWPLLAWKAHVTRRAEVIIADQKPRFRVANVSWLLELVRLSRYSDGPARASQLLLENGVVLIAEPQISGMSVDGAAFVVDDVPVIALTLRRDTLDNFWFTLLHEVAHVILHHRTGLSAGFFDDVSVVELDEFEREANEFARNIIVPDEIWKRSPARIAKTPEPIETLANQLRIDPAILYGRIRMERENYAIFSDKIGRGVARRQLLDEDRNAE